MFSIGQLIIILAIVTFLYIFLFSEAIDNLEKRVKEAYDSSLNDIQKQIDKLERPSIEIGIGLDAAADLGWNEAIKSVLEIIENAKK